MDRAYRQERDRRSGQERRQGQERRTVGERRQAQDRRSDQDRRSLDRVRDQGRIRQLESRWRAYEQAHPESSHAFARHVDITDPQLATRAAIGQLPNGQVKSRPPHATKWRSADAMVVANDAVAHSDEYKQERARMEATGQIRLEVRKPLSEVLGRNWRADVYGLTAASGGTQASQWNDDAVVVSRWERGTDGRWHPITCFPQPDD